MFVRIPVSFSPEPQGNPAPGEQGNKGDPAPGDPGKAGTVPANGNPPNETGEPDFSTLDPSVQNYIKKLRTEAGNNRTKAKQTETEAAAFREKVKKLLGGEDDSGLTPEQQIEQLQGGYQTMQLQNGILQKAIMHGIGAESLEFFQFKVGKAFDELADDEELTDEAIAAIAVDVKKVTGGGGRSAGTSPSGTPGGTPPNPKPAGNDEITVEQFAKSLALQSQVFQKDPARYEQLKAEAKAKNLYNTGR